MVYIQNKKRVTKVFHEHHIDSAFMLHVVEYSMYFVYNKLVQM